MNISKIISARNVALPALVFAAFLAQPASAQTTGGTAGGSMGASAVVTANCAVSSTPVTFDNVDVTKGLAVTGMGGISVICTSGTDWSASADAGEGADATLAIRQMSDGDETLNYALYTDTTRETIWGDGVGEGTTETIDDTGSGSAQTKVIYGKVLAGQQSVVAGSYSDTVTVTVTY